MTFHENVSLLKIRNFNMIANFDNGSVIGLTDSGLDMVNNIYNSGYEDCLITNTEQEELANLLLQQKYFQKAREDGSIKAAYVHVTQQCNLSCLGCYSHDDKRNQTKDLTYDEICQIVDKLKACNIESIIISGGEPFARDDIYEVFRYIKEKAKIKVLQVITNGTYTINYDYNLIKRYVDDLNISIDGYDEANPTYIRNSGIFGIVMNTVKTCRKKGIKTNMIATLHRKNIDDVEKYVDLAKKYDVAVSFSLLTCAGDFDEFDKWIPSDEQLTRHGSAGISGLSDKYNISSPTSFIVQARKSCGVGKGLISIGYDGNVYPCHMLHSPKMVMGNILECDNLQDILAQKKNLREANTVDNIEDCKKCEFA